ncbi:hypothetical protein GCM10010124_14900 [Pilimelia terevasa]|uniref:histidine kinase n=1 Tax=Pilimelia terevasa TaxID=53372 RepID=A0A8J3BNB8_9ACTN|nr:ATP-binding protein [Pilimelia terevasa]GGK23442.1 hypothetical protein GCM10010124_14900 [Pilimelia terevasa]
MSHLDPQLLAQPARLAAVDRTRRVLAGMALPLDGVARLAARLVGTPMGAICLVSSDEDLLVGAYGVPHAFLRDRHLPLEYSIGKYVVSGGDVVSAVEDLREDPELRAHALVNQLGLRSFLGTPLTDASGAPVGSLVVLDRVPRRWTNEDIATVLEIAEVLAPAGPVGRGHRGLPDVELGPLLESTLEAFVAADVDGAVVGWNVAAEGMFGWPVGEALGRRFADLFRPQAGGAPLWPPAPDEPAPGGGEPRRVTGYGRHRDGHEFPVEAFLTRIPSRSGPLLCGFLLDVSEQATLRRDAVRRGRLLETLLDSLLTGVAACNPDGQIVVANRALRDWYGLPDGWEPFPLLDASRTIRDLDGRLLDPEEVPLIRAWRGETVRDECILVPALDGTDVRAFRVNAHPMTDPEGRSLGAVAALHDITAQLRDERFRDGHLEVVRALAFAADLPEALTATLATLCDLLGGSGGEAWLSDEVTDTLQPAARWPQDGWECAYCGDLAGRCVRESASLRDVDPDSRVPCLALPVRAGSAVLGALVLCAPDGVVDDVGVAFAEAVVDQLAAYLSRRRAAELRTELGRSKDDFVALVGHEMRTPLTSIGSYAELLLGGAAHWSDDERQMLEAIARNTAGLRAIVEDLLDLAAIESGHADIREDAVDLAGVARAELAALAAVAEGNGVALDDGLPAALPLRGDRDRLRLLAANLLSNAVKYSPDGGHVEVSGRTEGDIVEFSVIDGGVGIPPAERDRLFRRFFRASNARDRGIAGTGLGLSISRAIVEAHGGTLTLTDRGPAGHGTIATVRLPRRTP